ncbi:MAG TPA: class I SAM-dependent methyltransferase [Alphaproteobacteria bacterium]|nr:class I SAM-dependent methyltransferase [Alphaproteobacteria bacterium]
MNVAKQAVKAVVPARYHAPVKRYGYRALHFGLGFYCPCCGSRVRGFKPYHRRSAARCPVCDALERDRLASLLLRRRAGLLRGARRILHVAPEPSVARLLREERADYVSLDLGERDAALRADLTRMPFGARAFDGIYCSHVLEHIPADFAAMREMCRVLRPGGWAILQVPIRRGRTIEDPAITDPGLRRRLFGQSDHVRFYGEDICERLHAAGLAVSVENPGRGLTRDTVRRLGLSVQEPIFLCHRPR